MRPGTLAIVVAAAALTGAAGYHVAARMERGDARYHAPPAAPAPPTGLPVAEVSIDGLPALGEQPAWWRAGMRDLAARIAAESARGTRARLSASECFDGACVAFLDVETFRGADPAVGAGRVGESLVEELTEMAGASFQPETRALPHARVQARRGEPTAAAVGMVAPARDGKGVRADAVGALERRLADYARGDARLRPEAAEPPIAIRPECQRVCERGVLECRVFPEPTVHDCARGCSAAIADGDLPPARVTQCIGAPCQGLDACLTGGHVIHAPCRDYCRRAVGECRAHPGPEPACLVGCSDGVSSGTLSAARLAACRTAPCSSLEACLAGN